MRFLSWLQKHDRPTGTDLEEFIENVLGWMTMAEWRPFSFKVEDSLQIKVPMKFFNRAEVMHTGFEHLTKAMSGGSERLFDVSTTPANGF